MAIVPARGGSKGVPRKNLRPLHGAPLLLHTLRQAKEARSIDVTVVSTDDDEIAAVARDAGVTVIERPAALAGDATPTLPVLLHALETLGPDRMPDKVVTLQPTSPLRHPRQIDEAVAMLTPNVDAVIGVCETEHSPYKMYDLDGDRLRPLLDGSRPGRPRQALPRTYRENGAVYVTWRRVLVESHSIWGDRPRAYVMDQDSSLDIDTMRDLQLAELILCERLLAETGRRA